VAIKAPAINVVANPTIECGLSYHLVRGMRGNWASASGFGDHGDERRIGIFGVQA
jgi:hypothetical protein